MRRSIAAFLVAFAAACGPVLAQAPESIERGKRATALVEIRDGTTLKGYGSAFCIDPSGIFVTNAHVAEAVAAARLKLVLNPGEANQSSVSAQVLRADKAADLAVLQVDTAGRYDALPLGAAGALYDSEEVTAFGYPFGAGLALDERDAPSVSVNVGRVTSLRKRAGELDLIQVDAALNPGNSGGPLMDGKGNVVGIVQKGLPGSGINFAIPVSRLSKLLADPIVSLTPASVDYRARSTSQTFRLSFASLAKDVHANSAELVLRTANQPARTLTAPVVDGHCSFEAVPVPTVAAERSVSVTADFDAGSVTGRATDATVVVAGQQRRLSELARVEGGKLSGTGEAVEGLTAIDLDLGGQVVRLNLSTARDVVFAAATVDAPAVSSVPHTLTLRSAGAVVATKDGTIAIDNVPGQAVATARPVFVRHGRAGRVILVPNGDAAVRRTVEGDPRVALTEVIGAQGGGPFNTYDPDYRPMIGLSYSLGEWMRVGCVHQVEGIFNRADADALHGHVQTVVARDGYAVGGLLVERDDTNVVAFAVVFMACRDGRLVPSDRYTSPWVGDHKEDDTGGHAELGCDGRTVVGLCGRRGLNVAGLGLVLRAGDPTP
jgi:S1-C subfamily serine protease